MDVITVPQVAPLNTRMFLAMLKMSPEMFGDAFKTAREPLLEQLKILEAKVHTYRKSLVRDWLEGSLSVERLRSQIAVGTQTKGISRGTFLAWVRNHGWGQPDLDHAASVILFTQMGDFSSPDGRRRVQVPDAHSDEEIMWCWRQAPPSREGVSAPLLPCPWPNLPRNLETGTLIISGWGMRDSSWKPFPSKEWPFQGAVRFNAVDEESLGRWDSTIDVPGLLRMLENAREERGSYHFEMLRSQMLREYADSLLGRLALSKLSELPTLDNYPVVWPSHLVWPREVSSQLL